MHDTSTCNDESFFGLFEFTYIMHDAIDCGLVYEGITILKDIETGSGKRLNKGDEFHQVNFDFKEQTLSFVIYESAEAHDRSGGTGTLNPTKLVVIQQAELAQFLYW